MDFGTAGSLADTPGNQPDTRQFSTVGAYQQKEGGFQNLLTKRLHPQEYHIASLKKIKG